MKQQRPCRPHDVAFAVRRSPLVIPLARSGIVLVALVSAAWLGFGATAGLRLAGSGLALRTSARMT